MVSVIYVGVGRGEAKPCYAFFVDFLVYYARRASPLANLGGVRFHFRLFGIAIGVVVCGVLGGPVLAARRI